MKKWSCILILIGSVALSACNNSSNTNSYGRVPEAENTVRSFYDWYLSKGEDINLEFDMRPDSILQIKYDNYFQKLRAPGFLDEDYFKSQAKYLDDCNKKLLAEKQTDGVPDCIAFDLITHEQEKPNGIRVLSSAQEGATAIVNIEQYMIDSQNPNDKVPFRPQSIRLKNDNGKWTIMEYVKW